ncbi:Type III restriction enzyme, res subunit [Poriferisphaera corsica]|uniref:Type III restriction enzyme, res subunit n=1 Tax=Poriferisphaera corsica TaxID=2528020 RepID=A0A517YS67_9BACT|nr:DEAD/DEAH box helicase family protein [Poriferisphaera corsica]QDU33063.1 Type III restriction enzyme, res subunit [Poriferisphaera corsica]
MSDVHFQFDPKQQFQLDAIESTVKLFDGQPRNGQINGNLSIEVGGTNAGLYQNGQTLANQLDIKREQILKNLRAAQDRQGLMPDRCLIPELPDDTDAPAPMNFTISMETGTGKTYVYLRTMREMHAEYGWSKFFIVVPSVAIREGVLQSLRDTDQHLRELYNGEPMDFFVYDGKKPTELAAFARNSCLSVCIINIQAFIKDADVDHTEEEAKRSGNVIYKPNWDKMNGKAPIEFVRDCNPIVIIDEPQSVDSTLKSKAAIRRLNPMFCLRYSATHKEPYNMVYDLGPIEARRKELVKGIVVTSVREGGLPAGAVLKCIRVGYKGKDKKPSADLELLALNAKGTPKLKKVTVKGPVNGKSGEELDSSKVSKGNSAYTGMRVDGISIDSGVEINIHGQPRYFLEGEGDGQVDEYVLEAMVIKTVEKHLLKEKQLQGRLAIGKDEGGDDQDRRIKVLSLIFLDKVADYRKYDEEGKKLSGKVYTWIEEALNKFRKDSRFAGLPALTHANNDLHDGYFAEDNKGRAKDTKGNTKADESAYEKIMRKKGMLLDPDEALRIIVSHSALREGWDNPNVFQICKLGGAQTATRRRQELGRGLRLPVDASGVRIRDKVINELTVVGAEDYTSYAKGLQNEFQEECGVTFGVVLPRAFAELESTEGPVGFEKASKLHRELKDAGLLDAENKLVENPDFKTMPEQLSSKFRPFSTEIEKILLEHKIEHHIRPDKPRTKIKLNKSILDHPAFQTMWKKVSQRTRYRLNIDSCNLIKTAAKSLKSHFDIHDINRKVEITTSDLQVSAKGVSSGKVRENRAEHVDFAERLPDPLSYLSARIDLSRKSLSSILKDSGTFANFSKHPARYLEDCTRLIRHTLSSELVEGVTYEPIGGTCYEQRKLNELDGKEIAHSLDRIVNLPEEDGTPLRSLTQPVAVDSNVEYKFALDMQNRGDVLCFAKLPNTFKVPTPVGDYNPDWVVIKNDGHGEPVLYLVRETKDTLVEESLRESERFKIRCARKHFEALGVDYAVCSSSDQV